MGSDLALCGFGFFGKRMRVVLASQDATIQSLRDQVASHPDRIRFYAREIATLRGEGRTLR